MSESNTPSEPEDREGIIARCSELEAEIRELRALIQRLKAENERLARASVDRDYERPPHYL